MRGKSRVFVGIAGLVVMGVLPLLAEQAERVKTVGSRFMCMCNCNQVLTQCNHVGCYMSTAMLKELGEMVGRGDTDAMITAAFVKEYGTTVFAEPPKSGFSLLAWAMPYIYFLLGAALVVFFIRKWSSRPAMATGAMAGGGSVAVVGPGGSDTVSDKMARLRAQAARETDE